MSGFVYKVSVAGEILIKKEIPSPETIEEFLYEINALNSLGYSENVINFHGVVVDEYDEYVKGLLISYADGGALIDVIYDNCKDPNGHGLAWAVRERWARQIVNGLADIHESGFVQGDFTLSNIVIDQKDDAKIIDINRRGCPVGWEPPEATPLLESNHRISMYIGIKSDLYQLGMVLWALAMEDDEPDLESRPLLLGPDAKVPEWYRVLTETCLNPDPRRRLQASQLAQMFPPEESRAEHISVDDGVSLKSYYIDECNTVRPPSDWSHYDPRFLPSGAPTYESWNYAPRGRSPPSPLPSNPDVSESHRGPYSPTAWAARRFIRPSYSDAGVDDIRPDDMTHNFTPTPTADRIVFPEGDLRLDEDDADLADEHHSNEATPRAPRDKALLDESSEEDQALSRDGSEYGDEAANTEPLKEISHNIQKKETQDIPAESAKPSDDYPAEESAVDHPDVTQVKDVLVGEPTDSPMADEAPVVEAPKPDETEQAPPETIKGNDALSNGHPPEVDDGAAAALEVAEVEKSVESAPKAAEATTTEGTAPAPDSPPAEAATDKDEDKDDKETTTEALEPSATKDQDDAKVEEPAAPDSPKEVEANLEEAQLKGKEEDVPEDKVDDDMTKENDTGKPTNPSDQPEAQAEQTLEKDALPSENDPSAAQGPESKPDEPAEQTPGQPAMPASDDCPPGKLDDAELVNGEDVQEPRSSDPPDDSSPTDDHSGVEAEQIISAMPTLAETDDQVVKEATPEVATEPATTADRDAPETLAPADEKSETAPEAPDPAAVDTEPDSLAGIGSGLPSIETNMMSEQDFIHDDDFHATRRPEPLTT